MQRTTQLNYKYSKLSVVTMEAVKDKNAEEFRCTCCFEIANGPFSCGTCSNLVCHKCQPKVDKCPICRQIDSLAPDSPIRRMIQECKVECPRNCGKTIKISAIDDHSHSPLCSMKEFLCKQCNKTVKNSDMLTHMTEHLKISQVNDKKTSVTRSQT